MVKYKVGTFCDFGQVGRRTCIRRHKTLRTAGNQYPRIWNIYGRLHGWKVWQEELPPPVKINPNKAFKE